MPYNPHVHHRRSIRLPSFDYRRFGAYFVTICTHLKEPILGEVTGARTLLSEFGAIEEEEWFRTSELRFCVETDQHIVMPNHFHGIVWLPRTVGAQRAAPLRLAPVPRSNVQPRSLGAVVRGFKGASTKRINELRGTPAAPVWQRNYYERIVRDDAELHRAREYILNNPLKWASDPNNSTKL